MDTQPERAFDEIAELASHICEAPIALITFLDTDRLWFKSHYGLPMEETPRDQAFCGYAILQDEVFVVPDAGQDDRFAENPLVSGEPRFRFYAGAPLRTPGGQKLGTLCVIDRVPRTLTDGQLRALQVLSRQVVNLLETRRLVAELGKIAVENQRTAHRLTAIYDAATEIAMFSTNSRGVLTTFNRGAELMLGYHAVDVVGTVSADAFFDQNELLERANALTELFGQPISGFEAVVEYARQGAVETREWTFRHYTDRHPIVVEVMATAMRDLEGTLGGFVLIANDITDRKRAEEARRESEQWFETLSNASPVGIFRTDVNGHCEYTNPHFQKLTGQTFDETLGTGWTEAIHAEDRDAAFAAWTQTVSKGTEFEVEYRLVPRSGPSSLVHARASAVIGAQGEITGYVGTIQNITAARRAEESLRTSEQRTRAIIDNMMSGLITIDHYSMIRTVNRAAERLFGYQSEELVGQPLTMLVPASVGPKLEYLVRSREKSLGRVTEWEGQRKTGEVFPFELSMFSFRTPDGVQLAGSMQDVSQRKAAEQAKRDFLSTISHELRTPLTSIRGSLALIAAGVMGEVPAEIRKMIDLAERNSTRLLALINDLLDIERMESGRMEMEMRDVPLDPILQRSAESVRALADQQNIAIQVASSGAHVRADEHRITQVVINLLSNAIKFSPRGGVVEVAAHCFDSTAEVRVSDRGRGVPQEAQQRIFERFAQVDASDSKAKGGAGLGLAICRAIVE
ncbi:MAG: histidine kinase, partial [Acidobacteria bacterium]|nr:histidine kinase [Acidobacteriota bacterium]